MKQAPFTSKRWRRVEYQRLVDVGVFDREPLELIGGQLMVAEPKGSEHAAAVDMAYVTLLSAIPPGWTVRGQNPLALERAGIADYWIVNLIDRVVEVYREPGADLTAPFGWRYTSVTRVRPPDSMTPLGVPAAPVPVATLLP
jgi:hypothetical protein